MSVIILFGFILLVIIASPLLNDMLFREHNIEQSDLTYKQYLRRTNERRVKIPESSEHINIFHISGRDYWHSSVEAKVKKEDIILGELVSECKFYNVSNPDVIENVLTPFDALGNVFIKSAPSWYRQENGMKGYDINILKFGRDRSYCRGCWVFYNINTQTIRAVSWSIQHLSVERFKENLNLNVDSEISS